jgi:hypothetical protein
MSRLGAGILSLVLGTLVGGVTRPRALPPAAAQSPLATRGPTCQEQATTAEPGCPQPLQSHRSGLAEFLGADSLHGPMCVRDTHNDVSVVTAMEPDGGYAYRTARKLFDFGVLGGHEPLPLGDESVINGAPMRIATLPVGLPADEVLRRYSEQLRLNGVAAMTGQFQGKQGPHYLTFLPQGSSARRTIIIFPEGEMSTVVFSVGDPGRMAENTAAIPAGLPHPDAVVGVVVDETRDGMKRQTDVAFTWPKHGVPEAKQYYQAELKKSGFRTQSSTWNNDAPGAYHQNFARGTENLGLTLDKDPDGDGVRVGMLWIHT